MKNWILIISVVLILAFFSIFEAIIIPKQFKEFETTLTKLSALVEDEAATEEDAVKMQDDWTEKKKFLHIFIPHNDIKEMDLWISETVAYVSLQNFEEAQSKLVVLHDLCDQIPKLFIFKIGNLF